MITNEKIEKKIEIWKKDLLDLSLRNRLINYKTRKTSSIPILEPSITDIFETLVIKERSMTFTPIPSEENDEEDIDYKKQRLAPREILCNLEDKDLNLALNRLRLRAKTSYEEMGINTLFIAFGFIKWSENSTSKNPLLSPILLVPVEIIRKNLASKCEIRVIDEDIVINPTLAKKLEEFGINLNEIYEPTSTLDKVFLKELFEKVAEIIENFIGWEIIEKAEISLFSFAKLSMYMDLEKYSHLFLENPVLKAIANEQTVKLSEINVENINDLDSIDDPFNSFQVLDADSSQQEAIHLIKKGASLVIQGPPGTGKSQTIANIIAESLGQNKTVLFVSEKKAALEVVKKRLDNCGLGDFCLELHSKKTRKRVVLDELERTLNQERNRLLDTNRVNDELEKLKDIKDKLNSYAKALHKKRTALEISAFEVHSKLIRLHDVEPISFKFENLEDLNNERLNKIIYHLKFISSSNLYRHRRNNVLNKLKFDSLQPSKIMQLKNLVKNIIKTLKELKNISIEEPDSIRTTYYENILGIHSKLKTIIALSKDPSDNESDLIKITKDLCYQIKDVLDNIPDNYKKALFETREISHELLCSHEAINKRYKDICELLGIDTTDTSVEFLEDLVSLLTKYRVGILFVDHEKLTRKFSKQYKNFFGRLLGGYKKNISLLKSLSIDGKINEESILSDLITAGKVAEKLGEIKIDFDKEKLVSMLLVLKETIEKYKKSLDNLFETLKITNTSVSKFLENLNCLEIFQKPDGFHNEISFNLDWLQDMLHTVENLKSLLENISALVDIGNFVENGFIRDYESTLVFFNNLEEELPNIDEWFSLKNNVQILRENGLEDFLKKTDTKRDQSSNLVNIFLKGFFSDLLSKFYEEDKILGMLSKQERLSLIEEFKELDIKQQSIARHRLVSHLASKMPEIDVVQVESAETSILKREISKKRRNKSIRRLFSETPNLIKALKPCMMMSPLSVSIFLDPQFFKFDVVIFDEASQVFPEDAVGAIMRGKQIVVVGDNKQLPPTSFFKVSETETELEDHEEDLESLESILDECMTAGLPQKSLLWHYRSKHESLISFSNYHFYKNRLNTFPSSIFDGQDSGIDFCYVENGVYDRSKSRKNKIEAMKVAEMVLKHAQNKPNVSLGVVAFSEAQQTAILDQLEVLRRENPSLEEFFREDKPEEFFVKNLENVQGDERDEMIFSTGYGKDNTGKLTMNFGPLNKSGGERRLNVAITRARQKVTVVSSIKASDISSEVTNPGVKALREYLMYAENGGLKEFLANKAEYTGGDFESPFEESVYDELTEIGLTLHKQVGCSGYRIDLAVVDTENPGRYLLGIECDGAMYHSAKTARDRDRLRQQVLENLGWKIIRIWSRDWFLDKKSEVKRILEAVEEARAISNGEKIIKSIEDSEYFESEFPKIESTMQPIATYEKFSHEDSQKMHTFTQLIDGIIQKEAPIHIDELLSRIMEMYKYNGFYNISEVPDFFTDSGNISNKKLRNFVENYVRKNYNLSDKFILNTDKEIKPRRVLNNKEKLEHDHIYNLEIQKAIKLILEKVFSVNSNDLVKSVAAFFGYSRAGERIRRRILEEISELIIKNEIVSNNEKLTLPENVIGNTDKSANMKFMNRYKLSKPKSGKAKTVKSLKAGPVFTISPDGKYIFSGHDNEVEVIVFATKQRLKFTLDGHKYFVTSVVISPNGKCIVTSSNDKKIIVWKLSSNNSMSKHDMYDYILDGHDDAVCSTAISQDGKYLVSGSEDKTVKIWDLINYVEMRTLRGHDNIVHSVKISPIKNYVISGSWDETIKIWDIITGKEIRTLTGHKGAIYSLAISPGGNYLASGSLDETIKIWDITTGKEEHTLTGHKGVIYSLAISPDGNYLVSGSWDKTIKIWDIATGKEEHTLTGHESEIYSLAFSPDGRYLISGSEDRTMKIWDWKQLILS